LGSGVVDVVDIVDFVEGRDDDGGIAPLAEFYVQYLLIFSNYQP